MKLALGLENQMGHLAINRDTIHIVRINRAYMNVFFSMNFPRLNVCIQFELNTEPVVGRTHFYVALQIDSGTANTIGAM